MRSIRRVGERHDDPLEGVANLFDLGIVFALGFMVALVAHVGLPELLEDRDLTLLKDPGEPTMVIIHKRGHTVERYTLRSDHAGGDGVRLGVAYRLRTGEMIYVPEDAPAGAQASRSADVRP